MNMDMERRFHGYLALSRHSKLLFQKLGYELFGFYLALVMEAVWHRKNKNIGRVVKTQVELAQNLHMTQSTISRNLEKLEKHRSCIIRHEREKYMILGFFPLFLNDVASKIHSRDYANLNELYADVHKINAELQGNYANMQDNRTKNTPQSLKSSSNDYVSFPAIDSEEDINIDAVDREIERIKEEERKNGNNY